MYECRIPVTIRAFLWPRGGRRHFALKLPPVVDMTLFRYYLPMVMLFCFILPTAIPVRLWGESALIAFYTAALFRYCFLLHSTWFINSVAHM